MVPCKKPRGGELGDVQTVGEGRARFRRAEKIEDAQRKDQDSVL